MPEPLDPRPFEVTIDAVVERAEYIAHETRVGRVANAVAKITLDPILDRFYDIGTWMYRRKHKNGR